MIRESPWGAFLRGTFVLWKAFLRHPRATAALFPETPWCARRLVAGIPWSCVQVVVEWGCGTGAVTRVILRHKPPQALYFGLEARPDLLARLKPLESPTVCFFNRDFRETPDILAAHGIARADVVISTLPVSFFDPDTFFGLAARVARHFVQYLYVLALLRGYWPTPYLHTYFDAYRVDFCPWNLPPFFIFHARRETTVGFRTPETFTADGGCVLRG